MKKNSLKKPSLITASLIVILLITVGATICFLKFQFQAAPSNALELGESWPQSQETLQFASEYPAVPANNPFAYISIDQVLEFTKPETKSTAIIFFGFPACPWCQAALPVLTEVAAAEDISQIYYYNPGEIRANNSLEYQQLMSYIGQYLDLDDDGQPRLYVPEVLFIKNGQVVGRHLATVESHSDPVIPLTLEERSELVAIYENLIKTWKTTD